MLRRESEMERDVRIMTAMRCLACGYSLKHLKEQRCPECGRVFDPNDAATFAPGRRRTAPGLLCIALIGLIAAAYLSITGFFRHLVPPNEIPLFWQLASETLEGCLSALWIVCLLLAGFGLGRWRIDR